MLGAYILQLLYLIFGLIYHYVYSSLSLLKVILMYFLFDVSIVIHLSFHFYIHGILFPSPSLK